MNAAAETLSNASHKLAEAMYSKTRAQGGAAGCRSAQQADRIGRRRRPATARRATTDRPKEDVVDADFKEVK